jgi:hypothetical protein
MESKPPESNHLPADETDVVTAIIREFEDQA